MFKIFKVGSREESAFIDGLLKPHRASDPSFWLSLGGRGKTTVLGPKEITAAVSYMTTYTRQKNSLRSFIDNTYAHYWINDDRLPSIEERYRYTDFAGEVQRNVFGTRTGYNEFLVDWARSIKSGNKEIEKPKPPLIATFPHRHHDVGFALLIQRVVEITDYTRHSGFGEFYRPPHAKVKFLKRKTLSIFNRQLSQREIQ